MFRVVIPARYASSRFPGKPLVELAGRPMLHWVHDNARRSGASEVLVATDDVRIAEAARGFGAAVVMTAATHASGTDRIAEAATRAGWESGDIVVNLQGDEPLLLPRLLRQVAELLARHERADLATLAVPVTSVEEYLDPNAVKVVADAEGRALYFSRAPIPWTRDGADGGLAGQREFGDALRHVGMYAYRVGALRRITALPPSRYERREKLEQLRALEAGLRIVVAECSEPPGAGVDTPADLERARARARG